MLVFWRRSSLPPPTPQARRHFRRMPTARLSDSRSYIISKTEHVGVQWGPTWTSLNMFGGGWVVSAQWVSTVGLYRFAGPCMVGIPPTPVDRMTDWWTDTTENITFATPLTGDRPKLIIRAMGWLISDPLTKPSWIRFAIWKCSAIIKIQMRISLHVSCVSVKVITFPCRLASLNSKGDEEH